MATYCGTCCYMNREKQRKRKRKGKSGGRPHHYMCNICNTENEYC